MRSTQSPDLMHVGTSRLNIPPWFRQSIMYEAHADKLVIISVSSSDMMGWGKEVMRHSHCHWLWLLSAGGFTSIRWRVMTPPMCHRTSWNLDKNRNLIGFLSLFKYPLAVRNAMKFPQLRVPSRRLCQLPSSSSSGFRCIRLARYSICLSLEIKWTGYLWVAQFPHCELVGPWHRHEQGQPCSSPWASLASPPWKHFPKYIQWHAQWGWVAKSVERSVRVVVVFFFLEGTFILVATFFI